MPFDTYRGLRSPTGCCGGILSHSSARTRRVGRSTIEVLLRDDPPAYVIGEMSTAIAHLRRPGALGGLLADCCTREVSIAGSRFPAPVEVFRRRDLPVAAAPSAAITP
jgi:hypothetical protein